MMTERAKQKEAEVEALKRSMQSGMVCGSHPCFQWTLETLLTRSFCQAFFMLENMENES